MDAMKPMKPMAPMQPMQPMAPMKSEPAWWPADLGTPSSSGSQNATRYAYFESARRLVVDSGGGGIRTYDTGEHRIQGFGQQQGGGTPMSFQSDRGPVSLDDLKPA